MGGARAVGVGGIGPKARSFRDYTPILFPRKNLLLLRSLWTGTVIGTVVLFLLFLFVKA